MSHPWQTLGLALAGCALGAVIGWVVGRLYRERPAKALLAWMVAFLGACYALWYAATAREPWVATIGLGAAFGAMTAVKYSSGLLLGVAGRAGAGPGADGGDPETASGNDSDSDDTGSCDEAGREA